MKTAAQRGIYGRWLVNARMTRGYTTQEAALAALLASGYRLSRSVYAEYEAGGKRPSRTHLPILEAFWGRSRRPSRRLSRRPTASRRRSPR